MLANRLPYKFFVMFLAFAAVLIVPIFLIVGYNLDTMVSHIEDVMVLHPGQRNVYIEYSQKMVDDLVALSFYIFVLAFVIALFFSRKFLAPVKRLYEGTLSLRAGDYDVRLDITTNDELSEVTRGFNETASELRRMSEALKRKDVYIETMMDPLWVVDEDNIIVDINPAFTHLFGYGRDEAIGASVFDFLDEESEKIVRRKIYEREAGYSSSYEAAILSKSAGVVPVLISGAPILDDGVVVGKIGVMKDFREETRLRNELRREKEYSETVMDSMADQLLVIDRDFVIRKANLAARVKARRDITGEKCHDVYHGKDDRCYVFGEDCPVHTAFEKGQSASAVHEHVETSGRCVFNEITAYPIKDPEGRVTEVVEIISDITARKKFEDEIGERNRELTAIYSISRILSHSLRAEEIFNKVLDRVIGLMGMDGGGIFFLDSHGRDLVCNYHRGLSEDFVRTIGRLPVGTDLPGRVALDGHPIFAADISRDKRAERSVFRHSGLKAFACVPVRGKERLTGVFFVFSVSPHPFTSEEERTLGSISEMTGIAFENIRLYEMMRELYETQRVRRLEEQKSLLELSSTLASSLDMARALDTSLRIIQESCRGDFIWALAPDEDGNLRVRTDAGPLKAGAIVYTAETSSLELHAIARRETVRVKGIVSDPAFHVHEALRTYNTAYAIPIWVGDKTFGAFAIYYSVMRTLTDEELHFLQTVASILAVALERESLYQNVMIERGRSGAILAGIADGVLTTDIAGRVLSANGAAIAILGQGEDELRGKPVTGVLAADVDPAAFALRIENCLAEALDGGVSTVEGHIAGGKGERIPLVLRSAPVRDDRGTNVGVVFVLRDMRRENELDAMKADFIRSVSHEFRTPLTAIVGMAEMVLDSEVTGERLMEYVGSIHREGLRLSEMVADVLDIARIESGKEIFREGDIDFPALLRAVRESFAGAIEKKEIVYDDRCDPGVGSFRGDQEKLTRLLRILVDNAVTYSEPGSPVSVSIDRADGRVRFTVRDRGWGMSEDDLQHAGERFYRGGRARKKKGTGLGLALARDIARLHSGEIAIESAPEGGTVVTVEMGGRNTP